jgi:ribosomal protein S18 acetylase RimI-like enzyme
VTAVLIVTLATETDLPEVRSLDAECFPPGRPDRQPAAEGELEEGIRRSRVILARDHRRTIGYLHSEYTPNGALEICGLAVAEHDQRKGVGTALLDYCLAAALDGRGRLPEVLVLTSPLNVPMLELLFGHGFVGRKIMRDYFGPECHRLACYLSDLRPRTGPAASVPLEGLFATLASGRHIVLRLHKGTKSDETAYVLAPILGAEDWASERGGGLSASRSVTQSQSFPPLPAVAERDAAPNLLSMSTPGTVSDDRFTPDAIVTRNEEAPWARFDPNAYYYNNYISLRDDDRAILLRVGEFFSEYFKRYQIKRPAHALDIGSGANLYPALSMLPWSTHITLADHSPPNLPWLESEVDESHSGQPWRWTPFWNVVSGMPGYESVSQPDEQLRRLHRGGALCIEDLDILNMPSGRRWDLGTMFFVAESITEDYAQFTDAIRNFLRSLRAGSPFAAAFMVGSGGYPVKGVRFPAVKTDADDIEAQFAGKVASLRRFDIPKLNEPLRDHDDDNYDGMLLLVGVTQHS